MKRPTNLEDANKKIEKLLYKLAYEKIKSAKKSVLSHCCPFKVLGNDCGATEYCGEKSCNSCINQYWESYEIMIFKQYELEEE